MKLIDVEELYACIDEIIALQNSFSREIISRMRYPLDNDNIGYFDMVDGLKELRSSIRDVILKSFIIKPDDYGRIREVYDKIGSVLSTNGSDTYTIVTTNYDQVVEAYCRNAGKELVNGFTRNRTALQGTWANQWTPNSNNPVYLLKLHGSTTWHRDTNINKIIELGLPGIRESDNDIMILPTLKLKDYDGDLFSQMLQRFNDVIDDLDIMIVIGFSYRDTQITKIINYKILDGLMIFSISPTTKNDMSAIFSQKLTNFPLNKRSHLSMSDVGSYQIFYHEAKFDTKTIDHICNLLNYFFQQRSSVLRKH